MPQAKLYTKKINLSKLKLHLQAQPSQKLSTVWKLPSKFIFLGGETVTLRLLQHSGLEIQTLKLKSKILTCREKLANKYNLERAEPCSNGQSCLKKPLDKLSLILGMDLHHVQPKLVEQFYESHGFMAVHACSLSQKPLTAGNRMYPYNEETARIALSNTNSFGVATDNTSDLEEDNLPLPPRSSTAPSEKTA